MSSEMQKHRVINELRDFIKKLLQNPETLEQALEIARRHYHEGGTSEEVTLRIVEEINSMTSIHIPDDPKEFSEADVLFLELLKEVVDEEKALY